MGDDVATETRNLRHGSQATALAVEVGVAAAVEKARIVGPVIRYLRYGSQAAVSAVSVVVAAALEKARTVDLVIR